MGLKRLHDSKNLNPIGRGLRLEVPRKPSSIPAKHRQLKRRIKQGNLGAATHRFDGMYGIWKSFDISFIQLVDSQGGEEEQQRRWDD
jgi:hypothetical protein